MPQPDGLTDAVPYGRLMCLPLHEDMADMYLFKIQRAHHTSIQLPP